MPGSGSLGHAEAGNNSSANGEGLGTPSVFSGAEPVGTELEAAPGSALRAAPAWFDEAESEAVVVVPVDASALDSTEPAPAEPAPTSNLVEADAFAPLPGSPAASAGASVGAAVVGGGLALLGAVAVLAAPPGSPPWANASVGSVNAQVAKAATSTEWAASSRAYTKEFLFMLFEALAASRGLAHWTLMFVLRPSLSELGPTESATAPFSTIHLLVAMSQYLNS